MTHGKKAIHIPAESVNGPTSSSFNSGWNMMKFMVYFFGLVTMGVAGGAMFFAYQANDAAMARAYVVTSSGTMVANSTYGDPAVRRIEVENHIRLFLNSMYAFDERSYERNIERGLHLIGNDGKIILQDYNESDLYQELVKTNGSISVVIDSIAINTELYPYEALSYAKQEWKTPGGILETNLVMAFKLINVDRNDNNIHGLLIDKVAMLNNSVIE